MVVMESPLCIVGTSRAAKSVTVIDSMALSSILPAPRLSMVVI